MRRFEKFENFKNVENNLTGTWLSTDQVTATHPDPIPWLEPN
jgi:hypothetical protein